MVKRKGDRADAQQIGNVAEQIAQRFEDKPYGAPPRDLPPAPTVEPVAPVREEQSRATISLPASLLREIEDLALANKRSGKDPRTVSAIAREAFMLYLTESDKN